MSLSLLSASSWVCCFPRFRYVVFAACICTKCMYPYSLATQCVFMVSTLPFVAVIDIHKVGPGRHVHKRIPTTAQHHSGRSRHSQSPLTTPSALHCAHTHCEYGDATHFGLPCWNSPATTSRGRIGSCWTSTVGLILDVHTGCPQTR